MVSVGLQRLISFALAAIFILGVTLVFPAEVFGKFSLIFSVIQILTSAVLGWPNQAYLRYGRESFKNHGNLGDVLGARLVIHVVLLFGVMLNIIIFGPYIGKILDIDSLAFTLVFIVCLCVMPLSDLGLISAQVCERFKAYGLAPIIQRCGQLMAILFVFLGASASWELLIYFSVFGFGLSAIIAWLELPLKSLKMSFSKKKVIDLLRYSWAMPLATFGAFLFQWMDLWVIKIYLNDAYVGQYAWAYSIILLATGMLVPLAAIIAPKIIDSELENKLFIIEKFVKQLFSICIFLSCCLPLFLIIAQLLGHILVGHEYRLAIPALLVLFPAVIFQISMAFAEPIIYTRKALVPKMALIVGLMVVVKLLSNFILIEPFGISGSGLATVIGYAVGLLLQWKVIQKSFKIHIPNSLVLIMFVLSPLFITILFKNHMQFFLISQFCISIALFFLARKKGFFRKMPNLFKNLLGEKNYLWLIGG